MSAHNVIGAITNPPARATGRRQPALAGARGLGDQDPTKPGGILDGPDAWVQLTGRSEDQRFAADLRVEREYTEFLPCEIRVEARHAETGDLLAEASFTGSKWVSWTSADSCGGDTRLTFPPGFDAENTPVVIQVWDPDLIWDDLLGESAPIYLAREEPKEYTDPVVLRQA